MKKLLVAVLLAALASVPALATDPPDSVTLEAKNGNVTFSHKGHAAMMDCTVCHLPDTFKLEYDRDSGHAACLDCHKEKGAGPTRCGDCHKK
jgi:cytochrome c553